MELRKDLPLSLISNIPSLASLETNGVLAKASCIGAHGTEYRFEFSFSGNWRAQVLDIAGEDCLKIGDWVQVMMPQMPDVTHDLVWFLRLADGAIVRYTPYEKRLIVENASLNKFEMCWNLFRDTIPGLIFCEAPDDENMPRWEKFKASMINIDESVTNEGNVWGAILADGMFPW